MAKGRIIKVIVTAVLVLYPVVIFLSLVVFHFPLRYLSLFVIMFASFYILVNNRGYQGKNRWLMFLCPVILLTLGTICFFVRSPVVLKIYPALSDLAYIFIFGLSLLIPPPIVYNFARAVDRNFTTNLDKNTVDKYCRDMTLYWIVFFFLDGLAAVVTVFLASDLVWGIYNGGVSYALMGVIFVAEFAYYKVLCKRQKNKGESA
jgi:uncharacterized membrane protein